MAPLLLCLRTVLVTQYFGDGALTAIVTFHSKCLEMF